MSKQDSSDLSSDLSGDQRWPEIALVGSFPPPYGGISVHLKRLTQRMDQAGLDYRLYNTASDTQNPPRVISVRAHKLLWYLKFALTHHCRIVHLHSVNWIARILFGLVARCRKGIYIHTIHGRSIKRALEQGRGFKACITGWFLRQMDLVIAVNPYIKQNCRQLAGISAEKIVMIPAFIPPMPELAPNPPASVMEYIEKHSPTLFAVGWIGQQLHEGQDVYGIDMMIDLVDRLQEDYPHIGLVMAVNGGDPDAIAETRRLSADKLGDHLFLADAMADITQVMSACDLFLRPTNTDGDALSIREALWMGLPTVASDAIERPESCILFRSRNFDHFEHVVRKTLKSLKKLRNGIQQNTPVDYAQQIIEIYQKYLS